MMKIVWLSQYNVAVLQPQLKLNREVVQHTSSWIHSLSESLALHKDVELHIITHSQLIDKTQSIEKNGIFFHVIRYNFPLTKKGFPGFFPYDKLTGYYSFKKKARKIIDEIQPDVLHVHGTEGGYFTAVSEINIPYLVSIQGIITEYIKIEPSFAGFLQLKYEQLAVKNSKHFGCRTDFDSDFVKKLNKNAIIHDLPEAMNMVFYKHQWEKPANPSILFVGSVNKRKGIEDLIHAMHQLVKTFPTLVLKIVGSGTKTYSNYLNKIIQEYQLEQNISWLGSRSPGEVAVELARSSFFVLPSLMDNSPNCLAEAMAVGTPSLATSVGGIPSMINNGIDGLLFEKHDVGGLVEKIRALAADVRLQNKLSENARARAKERNYPPNVADRYVNVYKSLVK